MYAISAVMNMTPQSARPSLALLPELRLTSFPRISYVLFAA